jgi:hypothetical protein
LGIIDQIVGNATERIEMDEIDPQATGEGAASKVEAATLVL